MSQAIDGVKVSPGQPVLLGFDPGRDKCGLAVVTLARQTLLHQVVPAAEAVAVIQALCRQYPISILVMGNQTTAKQWRKTLGENLPSTLRIILIDEHHSTLEARQRYWKMYPARGVMRLLPQGLRVPPRPVDDIVAIVLVERYFKQLTEPL